MLTDEAGVELAAQSAALVVAGEVEFCGSDTNGERLSTSDEKGRMSCAEKLKSKKSGGAEAISPRIVVSQFSPKLS